LSLRQYWYPFFGAPNLILVLIDNQLDTDILPHLGARAEGRDTDEDGGGDQERVVVRREPGGAREDGPHDGHPAGGHGQGQQRPPRLLACTARPVQRPRGRHRAEHGVPAHQQEHHPGAGRRHVPEDRQSDRGGFEQGEEVEVILF